MSQILQQIKEKKWANSLSRTGFLQSKVIAVGAIMLPVEIAKGVTVKMDGYIWVNNFVTYSKNSIDSFPSLFARAFEIEPKWPLHIIDVLIGLEEKQKKLLHKMVSANEDISQLSSIFGEYVFLLKEIMKYYVFAVPLTDYCEKELIGLQFEYSDFAVAYEPLDMDSYNQSLKKIVGSPDSHKQTVIRRHLEEFAWIKTAYNIVESYDEKDLAEAIKGIGAEAERKPLPIDCPPVLVGLQSGIFLRNRMKELCQQLWFYFDPVAVMLADYLSLSRDEFFTLTPNELSSSIIAHKSVISKAEIDDRQKGFVTGFIDKDFFLLTGNAVNELADHFNTDIPKNISEFKGSIACKGNVKGMVRIIRKKDDFGKFERGEVLVTSMTTPDFVIVMKKSSAIITDEGGLSCHAAIMSRELRIPCIIGTKIATKVLKDGDTVEIDANKGVVTVVKRS